MANPTATNPQTGETVMWDGTAWVPMAAPAVDPLQNITDTAAGMEFGTDAAGGRVISDIQAKEGVPAVATAASLAMGGPALLRFAASPGGGAVMGGIGGADEGPMGVVKGAAKGAAGGYAFGKAGKLIQFLSRFKKEADAARTAAAVAKGGERAKATIKAIGLKTPEEIAAAKASGTLPIPSGFRRPGPGDITDVLPQAAAKAAPAVEDAAMAALKAKLPISQQEAGILMQLRGVMDTSAGRLAAKDAVKKVFPNNWQDVWKFLTAPHTRI